MLKIFGLVQNNLQEIFNRIAQNKNKIKENKKKWKSGLLFLIFEEKYIFGAD
jgi:ABC-type transporter MlaC component